MTRSGAEIIQFDLDARRPCKHEKASKRASKSQLAGLLCVDEGVFDRVFNRAMPIEKRESLAAVAATVFCEHEHNRFLFHKLVSPLEEDRAVAAMSLGFAGNRIALAALQRLLMQDPSERVQKAAIFGISGLRDGKLDQVLAEVLAQGLGRPLSNAVLRTLLGRLKLFCDLRFEGVFIEHAKHAEASIRETALQGLFFACGEEGLRCTRALVQSEDSKLRCLALQVLERHGGFSDICFLLPMMQDADARVRQAVHQTISTLRKAC